MEKFLKFYYKYLYEKNVIVSGSIALILQGIIPERKWKDIDLISDNPNLNWLKDPKLIRNGIKLSKKQKSRNNISETLPIYEVQGVNLDLFYYEKLPLHYIKHVPITLNNHELLIPCLHYHYIFKEKFKIMVNCYSNMRFGWESSFVKHYNDFMSSKYSYIKKEVEFFLRYNHITIYKNRVISTYTNSQSWGKTLIEETPIREIEASPTVVEDGSSNWETSYTSGVDPIGRIAGNGIIDQIERTSSSTIYSGTNSFTGDLLTELETYITRSNEV